jgi:hypothetical protein
MQDGMKIHHRGPIVPISPKAALNTRTPLFFPPCNGVQMQGDLEIQGSPVLNTPRRAKMPLSETIQPFTLQSA